MNIVCYYIWIIWSAEHRRIKKPSNICGFDGTIEISNGRKKTKTRNGKTSSIIMESMDESNRWQVKLITNVHLSKIKFVLYMLYIVQWSVVDSSILGWQLCA